MVLVKTIEEEVLLADHKHRAHTGYASECKSKWIQQITICKRVQSLHLVTVRKKTSQKTKCR